VALFGKVANGGGNKWYGVVPLYGVGSRMVVQLYGNGLKIIAINKINK